jgi:antitoxin YefM
MTAITYTAARENLASTMDRVCDDRDPVIITRNRDQAVVMLSLDDYESLQETAYLLRSPANAKRLFDAIEAAEKGNLIEKSLPDLEKWTFLSRPRHGRIISFGFKQIKRHSDELTNWSKISCGHHLRGLASQNHYDMGFLAFGHGGSQRSTGWFIDR